MIEKPGQYKRAVKRCEDGYKLCHDVIQMITERAEIEKSYAKNLKTWSKKWSDYLNKGTEYGTMKNTWQSCLNEAEKLSEVHMITAGSLNDDLNSEIKAWQKQNYQKSIVNQIKLAKEYEEEFKKAQKPWAKKYASVDKTKKDYHSACKSYQSAKVQASNSQNDPAISNDQKKKLDDKVEKYKKEVEVTMNKYKQSLDDLNSYNSRYIEDMTTVYKKCDQFEKERLDFFIEKFEKFHSNLNIYDKLK
jgi:protein kinase C and casein kinase substrate in neurons protein